MHGPINRKSPNNISKWQMGFNSAFKGLTLAKAFCYFTQFSKGTFTSLVVRKLWLPEYSEVLGSGFISYANL
jgi:hypothetical protein